VARRQYEMESKQFGERIITKQHGGFTQGMIYDFDPAVLPDNAIAYGENIILYKSHEEVRSGSRLLNSLSVPAISGYSSLAASKSGIYITVTNPTGLMLSRYFAGLYFVWDDGSRDLIVSNPDTSPGNTLIVNSSTARTPCTAGKIIGKVIALEWHPVAKRFLIAVAFNWTDAYAYINLYYASWNASSWTQLYGFNQNGQTIVGTVGAFKNTEIKALGNDAYFYCTSGIYKIDISSTAPIASKINVDLEVSRISGNKNTKSESMVYCRRYLITRITMSGNMLLNRLNGNTIVHETGSDDLDTAGVDYAEQWTARPVGTGDYNYGVLTGGTLGSGADTAAEWAAITDATCGFTANSTTYNFNFDFSNCESMADVADRIQTQLRIVWPDALVEYVVNHFVFTMPNKGDTAGYCTAGTSGTDISGAAWLNMLIYQGTTSTPQYAAPSTISYLQALRTNLYKNNEGITHYGVYATKDLGENGIDNASGKGNNSEAYVWVDDVPIVKTFKITALNYTVTVDAGSGNGAFNEYDIGSELYFSDGAHATINAYVSSTVVTVSSNLGSTYSASTAAVIGKNYSCALLTQSGATITVPTGTLNLGYYIFWSDGTKSLVVGVTTGTPNDTVTVLDSTSRTSMAGAQLYIGNSDVIYNRRMFYDTIDDDVLSARWGKYYLRTRFWSALPSCDCGVFAPNWLITANRKTRRIDYCQLGFPQFIGYYRSDIQYDVIDDSINALRYYPAAGISALCNKSTVTWDVENFVEKGSQGIGESIVALAQRRTVNNQIGCIAWGSICQVENGVDIVFTSDSEIRMFDGVKYGPNLAANKMMKLLTKLQHVVSASYDMFSGYLLWGTESAVVSLSSVTNNWGGGVEAEDTVESLDKCYRFAINDTQGVIGGVPYTGTAWVSPPECIHGVSILDSNSIQFQIIYDNTNGKLYWINTRNGATGSGLFKIYVDKDNGTWAAKAEGGGGTEIASRIDYPVHKGVRIKDIIKHIESIFKIHADDIGMASYSANWTAGGYRNGTEVDITLYKDADYVNSVDDSQSVIDTTVLESQREIVFQRQDTESTLIQLRITVNKAGWKLLSSFHKYIAKDKAYQPALRTTNECTVQSNLAAMTAWFSRGENLFLNRVTGELISGTPTSVTGVDGKSNSAFTIAAGASKALSTVALTGGSAMFWAKDDSYAPTLKIGATTVSLTGYSTVINSAWKLWYATGITLTGALTLYADATHDTDFEDIRAYTGYALTTADLDYYFTDMKNNAGNNLLPRW